MLDEKVEFLIILNRVVPFDEFIFHFQLILWTHTVCYAGVRRS